MRLLQADPSTDKRLLIGWCNLQSEIANAYAKTGVDEPHLYEKIIELYHVDSGKAKFRVENNSVKLSAGHVLVIDLDEPHTIMKSSSAYFQMIAYTCVFKRSEEER